MNRRAFLKALGAGATVTAAGLLIPAQPIRRIWAVGEQLQSYGSVRHELIKPVMVDNCTAVMVDGKKISYADWLAGNRRPEDITFKTPGPWDQERADNPPRLIFDGQLMTYGEWLDGPVAAFALEELALAGGER